MTDCDAALGETARRGPRTLALEAQVAAKVASHGLWILARVASIDDAHVEIEDIDDENLRRFKLPRSDLLQLPRRAASPFKAPPPPLGRRSRARGRRREPHELAAARAAYLPKTSVFAMYPDTTSFYKAEVSRDGGARFLPSGDEVCLVRFADDEDDTGRLPDRAIPIRFITTVPDRI